MAVNITGTVLASLYYEHSSSNGDQTGFLVGDVVHHVKDTISDSQINNVEVKTKTYVFDCIPCPRDHQFHNSKGEILKQRIVDLLPDKHKCIVGWYSFRRNSTIRPSYRERLLHYNLIEALGQDEKMFLFLLCSSRASTNKSTHTFDHSFLHLENNIFKKVAVDIINLGDTTHTEYRCSPSHTVSSNHGAFSRIVKTHEVEFLNQHGHMDVRQIQMLNGAIRRQLDVISQSVIESEASCSQLEQEVAQYRKRAKLKLLEQQQLQQHQQQQQDVQKQNIAKVNKGISVDDILSMDQIGELPTELLSQGRVKTEDEESTSAMDSYEEMMTNSDSDRENVKKVHENKSFHVKLTTPAVMHSRSSSMPIDNQSDSSQFNVNTVRTRSRSGNAEVPDKSKHMTKESEKSQTCDTGNKISDPFAFVGSMLAESKKDLHKNVKARSMTDSDNSDVSMETEESVSSRRHPRQAAEAAVSAAKSSHSTRSSSSKGKGDNDVSKKTKDNIGNLKTCGQESGQKSHTEMTVESSSSQDTYEMDVSSSPVY